MQEAEDCFSCAATADICVLRTLHKVVMSQADIAEGVIEQTSRASLKRKTSTEESDPRQLSKRAAKKLRRSRAKTAQGTGDDGLDEELHINTAIAHMDGPMVVDYLAKQTQRFEEDLSTVELEDKRVPGA